MTSNDPFSAATLATVSAEMQVQTLCNQVDELTNERDRLRVALKEATERNEAAERQHAATVEAHRLSESEAAKGLDYMVSLGRYFGRSRHEGESIDAWAVRLNVAIHENLRNIEATPCTGAHCVPNDEHQRVVNEVAALTSQVNAYKTANQALERNAAEARAKLDALSAFIRGGVSALVRG